jgi:hypothetical protein
MTRRILPATGLLVLACWLAAEPADVRGCGGAYPPGQRVDIADETALIVWDDAAQKQHFIRRATFVGNAYDFGFLVPTPSRPELEAADPDLFAELAKITEPKVEHRTVTQLNFGCGGGRSGSAPQDLATPGGVVVLEQKRVGDLDAAVLAFRGDKGPKPEDAAAELLLWLNRNQYAVRPDLTDWLRPYIENKWIITAFKIAGQPAADQPAPPKEEGKKGIGLKSTAVRMSFKIDRPFFPYREPADQRDAEAQKTPRLLRVYVAAKQRMVGKLGDGKTAWPGQTVWANVVRYEERVSLLAKAKLPAETGPGAWWITEFEDRSTPRPGTDEVYFDPSPDKSPVARPPHVVTTYKMPWWVGPVAIGVPLLVIFGVVQYIRKSRAPLIPPDKRL